MQRRTILFLLAAAGARIGGAPMTAHALPSAEQILTDLGLSAGDRQRVQSGEFVTTDVAAVSDRDLSFAIAFLVRTSPAALGKQVMSGELITADAQVQAWGEIKGAGTVGDLARLKVTGEEARALAAARPGDAFNLSADEVAAFTNARGGSDVVVGELRKMLLARYQAYRRHGLAGIAPYDRGRGRTTDHAADLRKASEATPGLEKYLPAFRTVLLGYPKASIPQLRESFFWLKSIIEGKATYILTHLAGAPDGAAYVVARRQYYVSTSYNGEQAVAGFLPAADATVVVFVSHAFTDQVSGFGGSMKRSLGSSVMARKMREIFEAGRRKVGS